MSETVYVPRVIEYNDDEPLNVDGEIVEILRKAQSRRVTVLVEEPASDHRSDNGEILPERIGQMDYRTLQDKAKEAGIKANQSADELRDALTE